MASYNHEEIEKKWQKKWEETGIYNTQKRDTSKEKEYVLVEWPYPSGNLHIGHWFAFAVVDIDTLWRPKTTNEDSHWKGRVCKIYTKMQNDVWKLISHIGVLNYTTKKIV